MKQTQTREAWEGALCPCRRLLPPCPRSSRPGDTGRPDSTAYLEDHVSLASLLPQQRGGRRPRRSEQTEGSAPGGMGQVRSPGTVIVSVTVSPFSEGTVSFSRSNAGPWLWGLGEATRDPCVPPVQLPVNTQGFQNKHAPT